MATYSYRCVECGDFDHRSAMGSAPASAPCPVCSERARRVFSAPMLARTAPGVAALHQLEERSRHQPPVVDAPSGAPRRRQPVTRNPLHAKLPRP
jgi:putative FmdB family regulatory protein